MTALIRLTLLGLSKVPPAAALAVSRGVGRLLWLANSDAARTTRINLAACFPDMDSGERRRLALDSLGQMVLLGFEFAYLLNWPTAKVLAQITRIEGQALLDAAWRDERGVLLLMPHFGHFELISVYLGEHYAMAAMYSPPRLRALDPILRDARERHGGEMYPVGAAGLRGLLKVLKRGGVVLILPDQVPGRQAGGVASTFFGEPVQTMSLSHRMMQATDPHVLMVSIERSLGSAGLAYTLRFEAPAAGYASDDEQNHADALNRSIEAIVERAPAQYQWEYKRFRRVLDQAQPGNIYRRQ